MITRLRNIVLSSEHNNLKFGLDAYFKSENEVKPTIIFVHGFNGFKDWGHFGLVADHFAEAGFTFVKFNLSHNGTSPENPEDFVNLEAFGHEKYTTDLDDIGLVIDYLHSTDCAFKTEVDLEKIYLIGHSRGGALVILKASEDKRIQKVVTWAGVSSLYHFWTEENIRQVKENGAMYRVNGRTKQKMPIYKTVYDDLLANTERLNIEKRIKTLQIPILVAHGSGDTSVSIEAAYQYYSYQPSVELFIIEGAKHTFGGKHPYTEEHLPEWTQVLVEKTGIFLEA